MKYTESGTGYSHTVGYEYDSLNNLTELVESINGTERTTAYTYDDDNRIATSTTGNITVEYDYDSFGRIETQTTKNGSTVILTESYTYKAPTNTTTSAQIATYTTAVPNGYSITYTYTYDDNGNITSISDGTNTTSYEYDSANQLLRENNQAGGFTYTWEYDDAGNILRREEFAYETGELGEPDEFFPYVYPGSEWGDLLTSFDWIDFSCDGIGNTLFDGNWSYTWQHGRELTNITGPRGTWDFTYDANGMRTSRSEGSTVYKYVYNGSQLSRMTVGNNTLDFTYDANGTPLSFTQNGEVYYYVTNLQGDIVGILDDTRTLVVGYEYDAWGNILFVSGSLADTIGKLNPLRYRGYVYDEETWLYYLQSRYYNPEIGRFINADAYTSTGQGLLGYNMFAYCLNNPVNFVDYNGEEPEAILAAWAGGAGWLCFVDSVLPIGDLIYFGGLIVLSVLSLEISKEIANEIATWDYGIGKSSTISQSATTYTSALDAIGRLAASKPVNLPSWKKLKISWEHIKTGHMPGGSRNPKGNKSVFWGLTADQIIKAIREAYNNSSKLATRGERILIEGFSESYNIMIEMWINIKDFIIETAYPK